MAVRAVTLRSTYVIHVHDFGFTEVTFWTHEWQK